MNWSTKLFLVLLQLAIGWHFLYEGVWKVKAFAFRELDFSWKDKQGKDHHAQYRYREDELDLDAAGVPGEAHADEERPAPAPAPTPVPDAGAGAISLQAEGVLALEEGIRFAEAMNDFSRKLISSGNRVVER